MHLEGGCYCGAVRYIAEGEPVMKAQCHCRECQYISGGAPNMFMTLPAGGLRYTKGAPKQFTRKDLRRAVTREFCAECGTRIYHQPSYAPVINVRAGTLDDTSELEPKMHAWVSSKQPWVSIPEGVPTHATQP